MNLRVALILLIFVIWCILGLWWYHDQVICNCNNQPAVAALPAVDSLKKDTVQKIKPIDTVHQLAKTDSTTSIKTDDKLIVYFPVNSTKNNPDKETLGHIKEMIQEANKSGKNLSITGHSDAQGKPSTNLELSMKRANRLKDLFVENGAKADQIKTFAKGQTEPIADNASPEGRSKNRRAEVVLQ